MFVKTTSHRSRDRLAFALGREPEYYFTPRLGGCLAKITEEEVNKIANVKGVSMYKGKETVYKCWKLWG